MYDVGCVWFMGGWGWEGGRERAGEDGKEDGKEDQRIRGKEDQRMEASTFAGLDVSHGLDCWSFSMRTSSSLAASIISSTCPALTCVDGRVSVFVGGEWEEVESGRRRRRGAIKIFECMKLGWGVVLCVVCECV